EDRHDMLPDLDHLASSRRDLVGPAAARLDRHRPLLPDEILLDIAAAVLAAGRRLDAVGHETESPPDSGGLLRVGQGLETDREAVPLGRELDEELLGVAAIDHQRLEERRPAVALPVEALDLDQKVALAVDERLEAGLALIEGDPPLKDHVRHAAARLRL